MRKIYINGNIYTITQGYAESFVEEEGRFIYIGDNEGGLAYQNEESEIIDLKQKFVTAGFNDSHMHVLNYGYTLTMASLSDVTTSLKGVLNRLKEHIETYQLPENTWVKGRGWNHDYFEDVHRFPNRYDLDQVSTKHPIMITRACGHICVCNSKALEILGLDETLSPIEGGEFEIENGKLNGVFKENALELITQGMPQPSVEDIKRMLEEAFRSLNAYGITSAQTDDFLVFGNKEDVLQAYHELEKENKMTVKIYEQSQITHLDDLKRFIEDGYNTGVGSSYFKIGPLKLLADGSLGARTALMSEPYHDDPRVKGIQIFEQDTLNELVDYASSHDMQVAIHAIGDQACEMVLDAYQYTLEKHPRQNHRHGIVHCQITRPDQLERFKQMELQAYIQSIFLDYDIKIVEDRIGKKKSESSYAFKTFFDHNHASNGSDCPVELPNVFNGMQCAITRKTLHGDGPYEISQALTTEEALASYTIHGAYASFEEDEKGSIEVGKAADFVILDHDPLKQDPSKIKDIQVLQTYLDGKCVYTK